MDQTKVIMRPGQGREMLLLEPGLFRFHRYLLILAHARCYSTLLCHILGSHPSICGYAEALIPYETPVDLIRLNCEAYRTGNYRSDREFVVGKNIYDTFPVSDQILSNPRVTPIFLLREPEASIASQVRYRIREHELGLCNWGPNGANREGHIELAATYYADRLETLRSLLARMESMGKRGIFLTPGDLLNRTAATFRLLERELGLTEPLREEYHVFPYTGAPGSGDTSEVIRSGRIVRDRETDDDPIPIPPHWLEPARRAYEGYRAACHSSAVLVRVGE